MHLGINGTILVVEDDPRMRVAVCRLLARTELEVLEADTCAAAGRVLDERAVDYILTDVHLPDGLGFDLLERARGMESAPGVVVMTGDESVATAIGALHRRADDYLIKPFSYEALVAALERAHGRSTSAKADVRVHAKRDEREASESLCAWRARYAPKILGEDRQITRVFDVIRRVCDTDCSVLITGQSGTGKELVARALHDASDRSKRPFVTVNCAAIPENLLESELFGHARGAFTGATAPRVGRFAAADGGTLFLDEIGELPLALQAKLLRAVQEKEITPVGESRVRRVDVRVVAATHRDLEAMVEAGEFREDLLYRVQVVPIELPSLCDRAGDIPALIEAFVARANQRRGRDIVGISDEAMEALCAYGWPGNIRQLENVIERMVLLRGEGLLDLEDLPAKIRDGGVAPRQKAALELPEAGIDLRDAVEQFENRLILQALERTGWNKNRAAAVLRMNRTTLVEKLKKKNLADERSAVA
ncbi:MAG: sigma-54 dependent transcriptional regulator [Myxococcales bacterium]|nr:sigma-54 dependent transcriptional regulator [Myxococcales bacterium]